MMISTPYSFVNPSRTRREIDRVANHRRLGFFLGAKRCENDFAVVDADAHVKLGPAARAPVDVQLAEAREHAERGGHGELGVARVAFAVDVSPDGENRVADEFVERAIGRENALHHLAEIFVELRDELRRIGLLGQRREAAQVAHQDGATFARTAELLQKTFTIFDDFADNIF